MTCREVHEVLAAYADQQLAAGERETIAAHLCGCASCRRDLADLIDVRTLLGACAAGARPPLPDDLPGRLVAIAGPDAGRELWLSAGGANRLPSPRRRRRNRTLFMVTALAASAVGAMGSVALMAPGLPRIDDPDGTPSGGVPLAFRSTGPGRAAGVSCPQGFDCPTELAGLELAAADTAGNARIELTYGSSSEMVVVLQQRGQLSGRADAGVAAQAWQSGETVYCVMADDKGLAEQAAGALPHARAAGPSARERLAEGWHQLVGHRG